MTGYTALVATLGLIGAILAIVVTVRPVLRLSVRACTCDVSLKGKTVIVTGANSGLGFETALELAERGARVVLACRSEERGAAARDRILARGPASARDVLVRRLDLASLASVRQFAAETLAAERRLDVLVNNAGALGLGNRHTADRIVEEMQVNHFGPFLLTLLLLPLLHRSGAGRVVTVSSVLHHLGAVDLERINAPGSYGDVRTYCNSKLCNVAFTVELARRLRGAGGAGARVTANCLHPGIVSTGVASGLATLPRLGFGLLCWVCARSAREGAQTAVHLAAARALAGGVSGEYYTECARGWMSPRARDPRLGALLWQYSETLVGYNFQDLKFDEKTSQN